MKTLNIGEKEYKLEYSFEAAEYKDVVQKMFNMLSGAYLAKTGITENDSKEVAVSAMIDGVSTMVSEIPHVVKSAFYAGLLENNPVSEEEANKLLKQYMKENKIGYGKLYEDIKQCMEDDDFFDLSGLKDMLEVMNKSVQEQTEKEQKIPQDHKKKSTSTK